MFRRLGVALSLALLAPMAAGTESAPDILGRMSKTYASVQSYSDTGVVLQHLRPGDPPTETTFETAFARPNLFRFAWASHHPYPPLRNIEWRSVIWSDGTAAFTRYGFGPAPETKREESLTMAIAGATGVSGGAAHTVPRLLMPEIGGFALDELQSPVLVASEAIDGVTCYHIRGSYPRIGSIDLWIGITDYLLRKLQMHLGGRLSEELRRDVHINETIPAPKFLP